MEYAEQILGDTKILLGINDTEKDAVLRLMVSECINAIKSYCRIDALPYQLIGFTADIAAKKYKRDFLGESGAVTSVTEGDRQINFSVPNSLGEDYAERLAPFVNRRGRLPSEMKRR